MLSLMPPQPQRGPHGAQPVIDWIIQECQVDHETAAKTFASAKQAKYLVLKPHEGKNCWHFDARSGYFHWHKPAPPKPSAEQQSSEIADLRAALSQAHLRAVKAESRPILTPVHLKALAFITAKATATKDAAIAVVEEALECDTETAKRYLNDLFKHGLIDNDGRAAEAMAEIVSPD